jgi:hypothetical protein
MNPLKLTSCELIYETEIHFTQVIEYGISLVDISSGKQVVPPAGARFDQTFEGVLFGPRLRGKIRGIDYLSVRADGQFRLHLHGCLTTEDGENIALSSEGVSIHIPGVNKAQLRSSVTLFTNSAAYEWLNKLQLWAVGILDADRGEAAIKAYSV